VAVIESVFTDLERESPIVSPEILKWELEIGRNSIHAIQHLQEGVCILAQDHSRDNGDFIALIGADQLIVLAFKEERLFIEAMVHARGECGT
jgi:hypothetical protein